MLVPALDETKRQLLADTRRLLDELRDRLVRLDAEEAHQRALGASLDGLEEPFLLVVVGEWNSGKSAFINALLGQPALEEGVTPTTTRIGVLGHGERLERRAIAAGIDALTAPAEILRSAGNLPRGASPPLKGAE